ncbi:MAG: MarR family winged helix-turn-helix transcriptional regulator [Bacteroidota bacterium]
MAHNAKLELDNIFIVTTKLRRKLDAQIEAELHYMGYKNFKSSYLPILIMLYKEGNSVVNIAYEYGISKQAISKLTAEMMGESLLKTLVNKEDRRSVTIVLSAKGKRMAAEARKCVSKLIENYKTLIGKHKYEIMQDSLLSLFAFHD